VGASADPNARTLLAKHLVQFRRGQHQHLRHLANPPPLLVAVGRRRQRANFQQGLSRVRIAIEFLQEIHHRRLVGTLRWETLALGEPLAKLAFPGQQQPRNAAPARDICGIGSQGRAILRPVGQVRPLRARTPRSAVHQAR
jgi:hypothetical protein